MNVKTFDMSRLNHSFHDQAPALDDKDKRIAELEKIIKRALAVEKYDIPYCAATMAAILREGDADEDCSYCDGTGTVRFMSDGGMTEDACGMCDGSGKEL